MDINVITFSNPLMPGTAMSLARERQKAEFISAFSLLRLSALARLGGACIVIAGLWAVVLWALA
jgi:hypothetical protein